MGFDRVPTWKLIAFALPSFPLEAIFFPIAAILPAMYAKHSNATLGTLAGAIFLSRLFDAVSDPVVGFISDRTSTPIGRRKPWMVAGGLIGMIAVYNLYTPSPADSANDYLAWSVILYLAYTMVEIPHKAWASELSHDYSERSRISSYVAVSGTLGFLFFMSIPLLPIFDTTDITVQVLEVTAIILALLLPAVILITASSVPEIKQNLLIKVSLIKSLASMKKNRPFCVYLIAYIFHGIGQGIFLSVLYIFMSDYLQIGEKFPFLMVVYSLVSIASVPIWLKLSYRLGKHRSWAISTSLNAMITALFLLVDPGPSAFIPALLIIILGTSAQAALIMMPVSVLCDVIDYDTLLTKVNRGGSYFAIKTLVGKCNVAIGGGIGLSLLDFFGYSLSEGQNDTRATIGILLVFVALPSLCSLVSALCIWSFPIDERRQRIIQKRIERSSMSSQSSPLPVQES